MRQSRAGSLPVLKFPVGLDSLYNSNHYQPDKRGAI
jgi:hypothetical protein